METIDIKDMDRNYRIEQSALDFYELVIQALEAYENEDQQGFCDYFKSTFIKQAEAILNSIEREY